MKVAVVDCGSGNLRSVINAFRRAFAETGAPGDAEITADPDRIRQADRIVLPGVGAFASCRRGIDAGEGLGAALDERVRQEGAPFLGICVGMQLLAGIGREDGETPGLGWLGGEVDRVPSAPGLPIPHMGWNEFDWIAPHPLFEGIAAGDHVYFAHSYRYLPEEEKDVAATVRHGGPVVAAVARGNIAGMQFHPEKSQVSGLRLLGNFLRWMP